jgi:Holliday junction resolvase RusA-like endonuclease
MITFTIFGIPQPAGSKRAFIVKGRAIVTDANSKAKPWKQEVAAAAAKEMDEAGATLFDCPLNLCVTFYRTRPKNHYCKRGLSAHGMRTAYPATKPDATKLLRGLEDACTGIVWRDDAQIVRQFVEKAWGERDMTVVEVTPA